MAFHDFALHRVEKRTPPDQQAQIHPETARLLVPFPVVGWISDEGCVWCLDGVPDKCILSSLFCTLSHWISIRANSDWVWYKTDFRRLDVIHRTVTEKASAELVKVL